MGKWAERAKRIEEREPRANSVNSAESPAIGTNDTNGTTVPKLGQEIAPAALVAVPIRPMADAVARATLRQWHGHLRLLDPLAPPEGFTMGRWQDLCDDSWWLYETWASQLVRQGFSAHDVFGVLPWLPTGGVLLDRLRGARNVKLDGQGRAFWSLSGVTMQTCRGAAESLMSSGLVLIWEVQK